ncbi:MAG: heavy metal-binding domain-containing protein [Devosia sp.]
MIVATTNDLPGYRIVEALGVVRGITVRSRSVFGTIGGALQSLVGGNLSLFTTLAETSRQEAMNLMIQHAEEHGANAVIAMRYDSNEITDGVTEMLAYGTAVKVEKI